MPPTMTDKQAQYLAFIRDYTARRGIAPSFEEIGAHFGSAPPNVNDMSEAIPAYCALTAKLPYYALPGRVRSVVWQATSMPSDGQPMAGFGGGQGISDFHDASWDTDPITAITLDAVTSGLSAGSRASLYGIR